VEKTRWPRFDVIAFSLSMPHEMVDKGWARRHSASPSVLELEGSALITSGTEQGTIVLYSEYSDEVGFVCGNPLDGWKSTNRAVCAFAWNVVFLDQEEDAGKKALEEVE